MPWAVHDVLAAFDAMARESRIFRLVGRSNLCQFAKAAVRFTIQVAIECGHDAAAMRDMEDQLTAALDKGF